MSLNQVIGAEIRQVVDKDFEGQPARAVVGVRTYATDPADLWNALTTPDRVRRWFSPVDGDLMLGGRYQITGNAGGTINRCDPPKALDLTWEFAGAMSWVTLRLAPDGAGTRLTLEHIVLIKDVTSEHWQKFGPAAVGVGWDLSFLGLGWHIATGWEKAPGWEQGWATSDEAKAFMFASADAWRAADVANGEDPVAAKARADLTAKFYTGG